MEFVETQEGKYDRKGILRASEALKILKGITEEDAAILGFGT